MIIDSQRIRCYEAVGKFTCFKWIIHLAILIKCNGVKFIYATTSIFYHLPLANKLLNIKVTHGIKSLVIAISEK